MSKTLKMYLSKENIMLALIGSIAVIATFIAQTSSNSCVIFTAEQPKIPASLIQHD